MDAPSRLIAALAHLLQLVENVEQLRKQQQGVQQQQQLPVNVLQCAWRQYLEAVKVGKWVTRPFEQLLEGRVSGQQMLLFVARARLLELQSLRSGSAAGSSLSTDVRYVSLLYLLPGGGSALDCRRHIDDQDVHRSLCLRITRMAILMELSSLDDGMLLCLAQSCPPFGSWTSAPSEDDWLDPADEVFVDPADRFDWEEQVGLEARGCPVCNHLEAYCSVGCNNQYLALVRGCVCFILCMSSIQLSIYFKGVVMQGSGI